MLKSIFAGACMLCLSFAMAPTAQAQTQVIAYVDAEAVLVAMPDYKKVEADLEAYQKVIQKQLESDQKKMQDYYQTVSKDQENMSPAQLKEAEAKLKKMQEDLQKNSAAAEKKLVDKEMELSKPMYEKFKNAIATMAKTNGYAYVLDKKLLLFGDETIDATPKLKSQLGIP